MIGAECYRVRLTKVGVQLGPMNLLFGASPRD
jgi:hypothetical protein